MNEKQIWFRRKNYGFGWYPASWQGWAATLGYLALVMILGLTIDKTSTPQKLLYTFLIPVVVLTIGLIILTFLKGETPRWQWGKKKDSEIL